MARSDPLIPKTPIHSRKPSTFSRATTVSPKRIRGFFSLPGEIRNRIYGYYFEGGFRVEIAAKGDRFHAKEEKVMKLCLGAVNPDIVYKYQTGPTVDVTNEPPTLRMSRKLGRYQRVHGQNTKWNSSLCPLVLLCKQVYVEAAFFFYQNTTFVFNAPRRILGFLNVVSIMNLAAVTKLQLHYSTYGGPKYRKDKPLQDKHIAAWTNTCKAASKKLVGLQELQIWLKVNYTPLYFDLRQPWVQPLLQFRRLTCSKKATAEDPSGDGPDPEETCTPRLKIVKAHFATYWSGHNVFPGNTRLTDASMDLHNLFGQAISKAIMGSSEDNAMADFKEAWEGRHSQWQHHLNFYYTGW